MNRKIITIIILLTVLVFIFIKLLNVDSVILLNQPITNGKDPQINNNSKYSINVRPSNDGIQLLGNQISLGGHTSFYSKYLV